MKRRVLIVDDDHAVSRVLKILVEEAGHDAVIAETAGRAREHIARAELDLVVTDLKLPDGNGLDVLRLAKEGIPDVPVIMVTAYASIANAVEAMRLGAYDYLPKPFENERFKTQLANALRLRELNRENMRLRWEVETRHGFGAIIGRSAAMEKVREQVKLAAASDATVMLLGETGTGKELAARAIHYLSARAAGPFVAVNCGAIPETLIESELFGHRKGAFTGATANREGRFVQADSGTILLDEVTEMKYESQVKLLRTIEAREVQAVGAAEPVKVDVRIISATNHEPQRLVRSGRFREDLYYRLNVFTLRLPPLREHPEDVPELVAAYLARRGLKQDAVSRDALQLLAEHDFPGNVRELQNVIESGLILSQGKAVLPEHIADRLIPGRAMSDVSAKPDRSDLASLSEVERIHLEAALKKAGGNQSHAARLLGISRATLIYRMKRYGIS